MELNLSEIQQCKDIKAPRIVLYSTPKWGKTTLASTIPGNLLLDVEGGSGAVNVARVNKDKLSTFAEFKAVLKQIYDQTHPFKVLTTDTADWLENLVFQQAAREHGKKSIEDVGYGVGFATAQNLWRELFDCFDLLRNEKNIMILMLVHEKVTKYNNPLTESYDRYSLKIHDKTVGLIKEWADVVAFANNDTFIKSEDIGFNKKLKRATAGDRVMHLIESPAFVAGNRYGLPAEIPANWPALQEALTAAMTN